MGKAPGIAGGSNSKSRLRTALIVGPKNVLSNWFAEKMCEIMSKTTVWCDVMSLAAPDGYFLEQFQKALKTIADNNKDNSKPVIVRLMFGNIIGMYY